MATRSTAIATGLQAKAGPVIAACNGCSMKVKGEGVKGLALLIVVL